MRTTAGLDWQAAAMGTTAAQPAPANYIALSTDGTAPAAGDTTLASELTASGLGRAQATYAHTAGVASYTLSRTFTSSDATPRTINKIGVFNAVSAGTMVFETLVPNAPVITNGDTLTITETVSI